MTKESGMAQAACAAAVEALTILAKGFLTSQRPSQAIKCLEAICRSSAPMPIAAAKTRLWLAQVLLQHTQNVTEATQHLQQAVRPQPLTSQGHQLSIMEPSIESITKLKACFPAAISFEASPCVPFPKV